MAKKKRPPTPEELIQVLRAHQQRSIDEMQAAYQAGEKIKLLEAAVLCGKAGLKIPAWIAVDLEAALERYRTFEVRTLDEAFDVPQRKKGVHMSTSNTFLRKSLPVFLYVTGLRSEGAKTDDASGMFDSVAEKFRINATLAKQYYYYWKEILSVKSKDTPAL